MFTGFDPAVSKAARSRMSRVVWSWRLHRHTTLSERDLARWLNPIVSGWMNNYGRSYRSELYPLLRRINVYLVRWTRKKYKRLREHLERDAVDLHDYDTALGLTALGHETSREDATVTTR